MTDPLSELDAKSRRTVHRFMDVTLQHSADGMKDLLTQDCEFIGALSAGTLRGRHVIESHYRQVFKGVSGKGVTVLRHTLVRGRQVVCDWEILDPSDPTSSPAKGCTTLDLEESGLISKIKTEWNPRELPKGKGQ